MEWSLRARSIEPSPFHSKDAMPRTEPFDHYAAIYDDWFDRNELAYRSELEAVRALLPEYTRAVEIGVGTGRFACRLGIELGVEPCAPMARLARSRGVRVLEGAAEHLPLDDSSFDLVLMVATVCFVDDVQEAFAEAHRILVDAGHILIGFLDRETELGKLYEEHKSESPFYKVADFRSSQELFADLRRAGFDDLRCVQAIFERPDDMQELSPADSGYGKGLFIVVRATKPAVRARAPN